MNKFIFSIFALAFVLCMPANAQKKNTTNTTTATPKQTVSAEQLIQNYRFNEAAHLIQREIDAARAAGRSTIRLEKDLQRANMGQDMLRGTERVTFVDSFKVARSKVIQALRLSPESGNLVDMASEAKNFKTTLSKVGHVGYTNQLKDKIIFASPDSTGKHQKLHAAYKMGDKWSTPIELTGMNDTGEDQDYPFMMPDGVTLYYAAQGDDCLGGYDLFITRYNNDTKQFLKAENLGMPFNSPANDYLLAIDEANNLGWLVTDRNQKADSACVYIFIPTTTRDVYEMSDANRSKVISAARLSSIKLTQTDKEAVKSAKERLQKVLQGNGKSQTKAILSARRYIINDATVYTSLNQFKSNAAKQIAQQTDQLEESIAQLQKEQDELQKDVATNGRNAASLNRLKEINQSLPTLIHQLHTLQKEMRKAELQ